MISKHYVPLASHKKPKLENLRADVFHVVVLFWPSTVDCWFQVLISAIFPFVRKQYKVFSIHFKTSLPVTGLHQLHVDKYKQAGSGWKRFVGRDGGMKQNKVVGIEAGWDPPFRELLVFTTPVMWSELKIVTIGRNVRGLGKSMVVFSLFEKLRYSNERSTIF